MKKARRIAAVLLGMVVVCVIAVGMFINGKLDKLTYDKDSSITINSEVEDDTEGADISNLPEGSNEVTVPEGEVLTDNDVFNILLLGTDERTKEFNTNARADAMMLLSLNLKKGTAKLVSLERGVGVPIEGRNIDLLTHTFRYGGAELTLKTVQDCFKVDVDRYVRVNFNIFEQIINAIGGVDINLTAAEAQGINSAAKEKGVITNLTSGVNHLDGANALRFARLRKIDDDWHRIVRQRKVIQAAVNRTKNLDTYEINDFVNEILPMVMTNLTKRDIATLIFHAPNFLGVKIEQATVPQPDNCWGAVGVDGRRYIGTDFDINAKFLQEFFYGESI